MDGPSASMALVGHPPLRRWRERVTAEMAKAGPALLRCADTWSALAAAGRSDGSTLDRWRRVNELAATLPRDEGHAISHMRKAAGELGMGDPL